MDSEKIKEAIVKNVYHIPSDKKVPLHKHKDQDEIFYCLKGKGFGVLEDGEMELTVGKVFIAPAGTMHSVRSDGEMYIAAIMVPVIK
jgi:mannose-6-phosphate isomerase-like protein (cupin superfamily)